ncbi:hypothetical protein SJR98_07470 [Aeromonas hydrophila]|uniref:hypothetical protein n=1 Tax=Aeromonas hydrophila TaxID=644 RepID=UPI0029D79E1F|nr:hypothetical protein [Aeromonas hydrophila]MDX7777917.1 hypothetical protein [Aeromonas hydrophila]
MKRSHDLRKELAELQTKLQGWVSAVDALADDAVSITREGNPKKIATHNQAFLAAKFQQEVHEKAIAVVETELADAERLERQTARQALVPEAKKLGDRAEVAYGQLLYLMTGVVEKVQELHEIEGEASSVASLGGCRHRHTLPRDHNWVGLMLSDLLRGASPTHMVGERQQSAISQLVEALAGDAV